MGVIRRWWKKEKGSNQEIKENRYTEMSYRGYSKSENILLQPTLRIKENKNMELHVLKIKADN